MVTLSIKKVQWLLFALALLFISSSELKAQDCSYCQADEANPSVDFAVFETTYVDPVTGAKSFRPVGLDGQPEIESGLAVTFKASLPPGGVYVDWYKNGSLLGWEPTFTKQLHGPGTFNIELIVYDAAWGEISRKSKNIHVGSGITFLSRSQALHDRPIATAIDGAKIWSNFYSGSLGVTNLSIPESPVGPQLMPGVRLSNVQSLTVSNGYLYIADTFRGVPIYRADPNNLAQVGNISALSLSGGSASWVAAIGDTLHVASNISGMVDVFDVSNPAMPVKLSTYGSGGLYIWSFKKLSAGFVAARVGDGTKIAAWDVRNPLAPTALNTLTVPGQARTEMETGEGVLVAPSATTDNKEILNLIALIVSPEPRLMLRSSFLKPYSSQFHTIYKGNFLYSHHPGGSIDKFDITDPAQPYQMTSLPWNSPDQCAINLVDPDGAGPREAVIALGNTPYSFQVFSK